MKMMIQRVTRQCALFASHENGHCLHRSMDMHKKVLSLMPKIEG